MTPRLHAALLFATLASGMIAGFALAYALVA